MLDQAEESFDKAGSKKNHHPYRSKISHLLELADIKIDGSRSWDPKINNDALFARILGEGSLGLGEAYMDGWWDCAQLDEFFSRLLAAELGKQVTTWSDRWFFISNYLLNKQIGRNIGKAGAEHYNRGNDLYEKMLDKRMIYTCGYWRDAQSLDEAQEHKLELVARKLKLQPGMRVLDIGCGWGGSAAYLAQNYGVDVVGISVSEQQLKHAQEHHAKQNIEFLLQDFRQVKDKFDRIYSLGMFEHVGFRNYRDYFTMVDHCLEDQGLFLLHTIGHRITSRKVDPWINRYIFPNSILPSAELICRHSAGRLTIEDWHNFGLDYHRTLLAWSNNCQNAWQDLPHYDERFRRLWHYFLMCSAGAFKAQRNHLWQIVFSKGQLSKPYSAVRSAIDKQYDR